ncbi:hypothetical protein PanWU01x14_245470 [Parasponia andersonii]|uniref:Uncharacterized protein n=1 Tax=Parasponia andersonii TaxID=3476 RepID=A0A2P5BET3_PARAD|nr:hypothetical protein PanWU01x14_245470 [Parasponia andersonii]
MGKNSSTDCIVSPTLDRGPPGARSGIVNNQGLESEDVQMESLTPLEKQLMDPSNINNHICVGVEKKRKLSPVNWEAEKCKTRLCVWVVTMSSEGD